MLGLPGFVGLAGLWAAVCAVLGWLHRRGRLVRDWHRDALAVGVLVLAVLAFYWPLFFTESWIPKGGGDLSSFIYPIYAFAARWVKRGVIPLWNPHLYMGMPFAADNQSGLFYPLNLLFFLSTSTLTYGAVELMAVTHVFLAGLFTYVLLRDLPAFGLWRRLPGAPPGAGASEQSAPVGRVPAVAGAIAFMFSDLFVIHLGNLNIIATAAWLPLALLCFRRALARCSWGWAGWSGVVLGVAALVGHAQMFLYVGMTLALYLLFRLYVDRHEGLRVSLARIGKLCLAGGIAFGLAALSLIPAYDMTQYTVRSSLSYADASAFAIPPAGLVSILMPGFFGRGTGPFWGPWLRTEMGYVGVLPPMLAVVAVALTLRRSPLTRFWLILGGFGLLIALGGHTVLHGWTYALIPFFQKLRVPARAIFLFDFAVAVLAATGLDVLLRPLTRQARRALHTVNRGFLWVGGGLSLVGVPILGHAVITSRMSPTDVLRQHVDSMGSLVFFLLLLWAGVAWLTLRRLRLARRTALGAMAVFLIAFDLISLGAYVEIEPNDPLVGYRHDDALAFLRADPEVYRVETAAEVQGGWAPDWALLHEMDDLTGIWNPLRLGAYDVLTWVGISRDSSFYNLYNVKYLIAQRDTPVPAHFEPAFEDGQGGERVIYRNTRALPRAYMVHRTRIASGAIDALGIARSAEFDPATEVVLEKEFGAAPLDQDPGDAGGRVQIVDRGPNHIGFDVDAPLEGYLFVSEMWLPGWTAYVDGERQEVVRANYTFRAVYVPQGSHSVRMVYAPVPWRVGAAITLATVLSLLIWGIWSAVRPRIARRDARRG